MTRLEFMKVMAALTAGSGKDLSVESKEVYFDCLGDLSFDVFAIAAKRVLMEHRFATFPSIAELREAASGTQRGAVTDLSPGEAWALAWRAVGNTDPEVAGSFSRATANLPPIVVEAMTNYGINALCYGTEPVGVVRGQFLKIYEQLAARDKRRALMPETLTKQIEARAPNRVVELAAARLGDMDGHLRRDEVGPRKVPPRSAEEGAQEETART